MSTRYQQRRTILSSLFVGALFALCGVLGVLQYRWIGEVSLAAKERLRGSLQTSLSRLSADFSSDLAAGGRALLPAVSPRTSAMAEEDLSARYLQWKQNARRSQMFHRIALAEVRDQALVLRTMDAETGRFADAPWPAEWTGIKERLESRMGSGPRLRRGPPLPPPDDQGMVFDFPYLAAPFAGASPGPFEGDHASLILDVSPEYARDAIFPELIQRELESGGSLEYQVEVVTRQHPPAVIYRSGVDATIGSMADAMVGLSEPQYDQIFPRASGGGRGRGPGRGPGGDAGRWQMLVRHRAGSLEAVVAQLRHRDLAVTGAILLLMLGSVGALIRYTRKAQKLAEVQMEFVAGISHELRTPLTVIRTAAYNLRGKLAANPAQVERYGLLIQQESGRLTDLVEQVLRFSSANAGRILQSREPLAVEGLIADTLDATKSVLQDAACTVDQRIDPGLPMILGDATALKHALQNLLQNAAKYGSAAEHWIGISASAGAAGSEPSIEIRVADRGPGIPPEEQKHIFEPFFRGRRALENQIHGTGLGLNLTRKIVEAHGGTIGVKSSLHGTEFLVRLPAIPVGGAA
jgi:signal transduction histidine kinase